MNYVVIEECGEDWYLSSVEVGRYIYKDKCFVDAHTGRSWPSVSSFRSHLQGLK